MSSNIKRRIKTQPEPQAISGRVQKLAQRLTRNVAAATLILLSLVVLRGTGENGANALQTIQNAVESDWDQNVGKLTFVSRMAAESVQVFGRNAMQDPALISPVYAAPTQAWSSDVPYLTYQDPGEVYAAADGEVSGIAHDDQSLYIVQLLHKNGLSTIYYGLKTCLVTEGETVTASTTLGSAASSFAFEARRDGRSINCASALQARGGKP